MTESRKTRWRLRCGQIALLAAVLAAWKLATVLGLVDPALLPDPWQVLHHVVLLPFDPSFLAAVGRTLSNAAIGLLLATLAAVPLGLVIGSSPLFHRATRLLIDMGRSFPMIALMPVTVLLLGTTPVMVITVAGLATFWPILLQTCDGARQVHPVIADTVRAYCVPRTLRFAYVVLPAALPFITTGVRIGAAFSLLVAIGTELLSAAGGLGRLIGLVFQDYGSSLMPWMRARENVAFPLRGQGVGRAERTQRAEAALAAVGLADAGDRYPWQLSGGMQQRVAIARALAYRARILLMDEPFASVDAQTRFDLEDLLLVLKQRLGLSIVVVTHDIDEAVYLSSRVVVLSGAPATVTDTVVIDLPVPRDQIATKSDPRFAEARARILGHIRDAKARTR